MLTTHMLSLKVRLIIWSIACLVIAILPFGDLWPKLPQLLTTEGLQPHRVSHWGILGLCVLWLWLKRKEILPKMQIPRLRIPFILAGVALLVMALLLPRSDDFLVFFMLLGWLGIFAILFNGACIKPAIFLSIYLFSLAFPMLMMRWAGDASALATTNIVTAIVRVFGLPITSQGLVVHFTSVTGNFIAVVIEPGCAGPITIGVFIALFTLMMLDIKLSLRRAWYVFLFGLTGTWLLNIIRIIVSLAAGYYWGSAAIDAMHQNLFYIIFPLWYALFAYIYLRRANWKKATSDDSLANSRTA